MKTLGDIWTFFVACFLISVIIGTGVFIGLQWNDSAENHILVYLKPDHYQNGNVQLQHTTVDVVDWSPFHQADGYYLYLVARAYKWDDGMQIEVEWDARVQKGQHFRVSASTDKDIIVDWELVCSKNPLTTYEEVRNAAHNPYIDYNYLSFMYGSSGYYTLDCSR